MTMRHQYGNGIIDHKEKPTAYMSYEAKRIVIMNDIAMGLPYSDMVAKYVEDWGLSEATIHRFIECVKVDMDKGTVQSHIKELNIHRADRIVNEAMHNGEYDKAIKAMDLQNKTVGIYDKDADKEDKDINLKVSFNF